MHTIGAVLDGRHFLALWVLVGVTITLWRWCRWN